MAGVCKDVYKRQVIYIVAYNSVNAFIGEIQPIGVAAAEVTPLSLIHILILKAIDKTAERPLPPPDGIGKPLGNHASSRLSGYYKIKLKSIGYRVVYSLVRANNVMKVIVISIRDDDAVYKEAERRIKKFKTEN